MDFTSSALDAETAVLARGAAEQIKLRICRVGEDIIDVGRDFGAVNGYQSEFRQISTDTPPVSLARPPATLPAAEAWRPSAGSGAARRFLIRVSKDAAYRRPRRGSVTRR